MNQNDPSHLTLQFPPDFLWGSATSSHQVEGNNTNNDWWEWEQRVQPPEKRSGLACNQYELYEQDFDLIKELGHNAHRLSLEWSRIEPVEGQFDAAAIEHYRLVLKALQDRGIKVMLTTFHFTIPRWLAAKGGWENGKAAKYFARFIDRITPVYKDYVDLWCTINEPGVYIYQNYIIGAWPPQKISWWKSFKVYMNLIKGHQLAYKMIHKHQLNARVGIAHNVNSIRALHKHSFRENFAVWMGDLIANQSFLLLTGKNTHDYIGLNYYFNRYVSLTDNKFWPRAFDIKESQKDTSDLGWEVRPEGIFDVIMNFAAYKKPIYITENGISVAKDDRRARFLVSYLKEAYHAIRLGADLRGYFYWSFMDNFEWADGFKPRFGMVEVDYETMKRTPRNSAYVYRKIIENNGLPYSVLKLRGHGIEAKEVL